MAKLTARFLAMKSPETLAAVTTEEAGSSATSKNTFHVRGRDGG